MLSFQLENGRFSIRVVGVVVHDGHVWLHRAPQNEYWSLPGGRMEWLESSRDTLQREMLEELGIEVEIGNLLWVVENFFMEAGEQWHEIAFYYRMYLPEQKKWLDKTQTAKGIEGGQILTFQWFPLASLQDMTVYPTDIRDRLHALPERVEHLIAVEIDP